MSSQEKVAAAMQQATGSSTPATNGKLTVSQKVKQSGSLTGLTQGEIGDYLGGMKDRIATILPKHLTADRVLQMAATTIHRNPAIAKCTPTSLLGAVMQASILGFPPVDSLGYCYFVPYGKDVQFQIGYKGLIDLARRSGKIKDVYAEIVREGDIFEAEFGLERTLKHKPSFDSSKPLTHAYSVVHYTDGGYSFVILSKTDIEKLRMRSPMQNGAPSGPWKTDYEAMAKAKALKQLAKYLPLSLDQQSAVATDEAVLTPDSFTRSSDGSTSVKVEDITYEEQVDEETGEVTGNLQVAE
jgi:recombination protein RecT